jgi:acetyl-CoA synthetase (ADP-forming)/acetyltransferase
VPTRPPTQDPARYPTRHPTRYLERFFNPGSIAVIGASERALSLGGVVLKNLQDAGFPGSLLAVNPHGGDTVFGVPRHASIEALPEVPDLAIVCTSPARVPRVVDALGKRGVRAVMIVMGGLSAPAAPGDGRDRTAGLAYRLMGLRLDGGKTLKEATWEAAQPYDMRIMGPNCIGAVVPRHRLNASYAHCMVADGNVAYVGQSGVLALALMDWAQGRELGFSCVTTLGDSLDIDVADVIEYLADDRQTRSILLHLEVPGSGARLVSALRAAARSKIVIVMKSRRVAESRLHPGPDAPALADDDLVYDAVFRRAGVLRVERTDEFSNALETLSRMRRLAGDRLAIVSNGIGPGLVATDHLVRSGGQLAQLGEDTRQALAACLPFPPALDNPIDVSAAASPAHVAQALEILRKERNADAVLVIHVPTLIAPAPAAAAAIAPVARESLKPVLTCWMGLGSAREARAALDAAGISTFDSLEQAVDAFMHLARYRRNQEQLDQVPGPADHLDEAGFDARRVWGLVGSVRNAGRDRLEGDEALRLVRRAGFVVTEPVAAPEAALPAPLPLAMGITRHPVFGPLVYFGTGEDPASPVAERQVGLPPLNLSLARMVMDATRTGRALAAEDAGGSGLADGAARLLVRLARLAIEVPVIAELSLAVTASATGGLQVIQASGVLGEGRETAIRPYPSELEESITLPRSGRQVVLRPIRPEDAPAHAAFGLRLSPEAIRLRFFGPRSGFTRHELAQFTHIDYTREMAFIASGADGDGEPETLGVVRAWTDPDNVSAEFAVLVDDAMRGEGLGHALLRKIIDYTRSRGTLEIHGTVLSENKPMRQLARKLGFHSHFSSAAGATVVRLLLNEPSDDWQRQRLEPE